MEAETAGAATLGAAADVVATGGASCFRVKKKIAAAMITTAAQPTISGVEFDLGSSIGRNDGALILAAGAAGSAAGTVTAGDGAGCGSGAAWGTLLGGAMAGATLPTGTAAIGGVVVGAILAGAILVDPLLGRTVPLVPLPAGSGLGANGMVAASEASGTLGTAA